MPVRCGAYGPIIALKHGTDESEVTLLSRVPLDAQSGVADGVTEKQLQDLLFDHPQVLPTAEIDASYDGLVPVCKELSTRSGSIDALYVNCMGKLALVEFKLWSNPEARRKVIGQILDYAKDLASWDYIYLQRKVASTLEKSGNILYKLVTDNDSGNSTISESAFVDNVTNHLRRGEFLLLIVGDGIREQAVDIVKFVQEYSGLHFNLALVEVALYRDGQKRLIVQPRVLARTEIIQRVSVLLTDPPSVEVLKGESGNVSEASLSVQKKENFRFWSEVFDEFSFSVKTKIPKPSDQESIGIHDDLEHGLWFSASLRRSGKPAEMRCYLTRYADNLFAKDLFDNLTKSIDELREDLGDGFDVWGKRNPRLGFRCAAKFLERDDYSEDDFKEAVNWMREHLDLLVSKLRPKLQQMIQDRS